MKKEIVTLRNAMALKGIDCYIVPTSDAHNSEYVGEYDQVRCWLTGFTGSNGTLVVTKDKALLWTDGRYYIQCQREIEGSGIEMMKMGEEGVPSVWEYIAELAKNKEDLSVGFNGKNIVKKYIDDLYNKLNDTSVRIKADEDVAGDIWKKEGRPKRSCERVKLLDIAFAGKTACDKIEEVRKEMERYNCKQFFLSKLDDIMWLFNIRGGDVECNPVALSYAFISMDEAFLFLQQDAVSNAMRAYLASQRIILCDYDEVFDFIKEYPYEGRTLLDEKEVSYLAYSIIACAYSDNTKYIINHDNPTAMLKAVKNETEIKWMREYFLRDSVAMTKYIYWLKNKASSMENGTDTLDELEAAKKCDEIRTSVEGCVGLSFPTIAAYGPNAAMMHYEATEDNYSVCSNSGMLLTDCGGQYPGATTDVTRTIALGTVTEEEKHDFTLVLKGFLALMNAKWIDGCTGRNLDILARGPLWAEGKDYKCGTGHGVGCYLNVHEGPQNIRWKYLEGSKEAVLKPGMTITDEPGVYIENKYGIRTENTLLVEDNGITPDGHFLGFENLTWVPIDTDLIDSNILSPMELKWLKCYQRQVYEKIESYLNEDEAKWLKDICM